MNIIGDEDISIPLRSVFRKIFNAESAEDAEILLFYLADEDVDIALRD